MLCPATAGFPVAQTRPAALAGLGRLAALRAKLMPGVPVDQTAGCRIDCGLISGQASQCLPKRPIGCRTGVPCPVQLGKIGYVIFDTEQQQIIVR